MSFKEVAAMQRMRPILFSAPMVRAILAGTKTQTRRIVNGLHPDCANALRSGVDWKFYDSFDRLTQSARCKIAQPGDRLWVRETCVARELPDGLDGVQYLADQAFREIDNTEAAADAWVKLNHYGGRGRGHVVPAIHMPRWASRITLEVTGVRVERLQDISEADAMAEGVTRRQSGEVVMFFVGSLAAGTTAAGCYQQLWESINGPGSWDANPWVWVIQFRRTA